MNSKKTGGYLADKPIRHPTKDELNVDRKSEKRNIEGYG